MREKEKEKMGKRERAATWERVGSPCNPITFGLGGKEKEEVLGYQDVKKAYVRE